MLGLDRIYHWLSHFMCPKSIEFMSKKGTLDRRYDEDGGQFFIYMNRQQTSTKLLRRQQKKSDTRWFLLALDEDWKMWCELGMKKREEKNKTRKDVNNGNVWSKKNWKNIFARFMKFLYIESRIFFTSYKGRFQLLPSAHQRSRIRMTFNFQLTSRILSKLCLPIFQPICFLFDFLRIWWLGRLLEVTK